MPLSRRPVAALVLASVLWGVAASGAKFALHGFAPLTLLSVELLAATTALWITLLVRGYRPPGSWRLAAALGMFEPALAYVGDTVGLARTSASNASLIFSLESAFVVVLAALILREPITRALGVAVVVAVVGLAVLEGSTSLTTPNTGDLFVLGGALSAAMYTICARTIDADTDPLSLTAHQFGFATLIILPVTGTAWLRGAQPLPLEVAPGCWTAAILVGTAGYGASFILYNYAIVTVPAGAAGVIINLIPAFGVASAVLWLGEPLTARRLIGGALLAVSVAVFTISELRAGAREDHELEAAELAPGR